MLASSAVKTTRFGKAGATGDNVTKAKKAGHFRGPEWVQASKRSEAEQSKHISTSATRAMRASEEKKLGSTDPLRALCLT